MKTILKRLTCIITCLIILLSPTAFAYANDVAEETAPSEIGYAVPADGYIASDGTFISEEEYASLSQSTVRSTPGAWIPDAAHVHFEVDGNVLSWTISPVKLVPIHFNGSIRVSDSTSGMAAGQVFLLSGLSGSISMYGLIPMHRHVGQITGSIIFSDMTYTYLPGDLILNWVV